MKFTNYVYFLHILLSGMACKQNKQSHGAVRTDTNATSMTATEQAILNILNNVNDGYYHQFVLLGHPYSYLIDSLLNVFRNAAGEWAVAIERLGYNPRSGTIDLEIFYYGNCLIDLDEYNEFILGNSTGLGTAYGDY
jgi:hypothetical protein